jgi:hypothetical protein
VRCNIVKLLTEQPNSVFNATLLQEDNSVVIAARLREHMQSRIAGHVYRHAKVTLGLVEVASRQTGIANRKVGTDPRRDALRRLGSLDALVSHRLCLHCVNSNGKSRGANGKDDSC